MGRPVVGGSGRSRRAVRSIPDDGVRRKVLHVAQKGAASTSVTVEVDFQGNGRWQTYAELKVPDGGYVHHEFPAGFSAHWVRLKVSDATTMTAQFVYS